MVTVKYNENKQSFKTSNLLVNPVSSSENVKNPLFISLVRGANILAVAAFGLSEQICFFLIKLTVVAIVGFVTAAVTCTFGFTKLSASKWTGPLPAGNKNVVESTRHFGLKTFSVDDFLIVAVTATVGCCFCCCGGGDNGNGLS